jgi:hypothetical protein
VCQIKENERERERERERDREREREREREEKSWQQTDEPLRDFALHNATHTQDFQQHRTLALLVAPHLHELSWQQVVAVMARYRVLTTLRYTR